MAETIAELRAMSTDELITKHDAHAKSVQVGTNHYLRELQRRDQLSLGEKMLTYTRWITLMTVFILIATLANVAIFIFQVVDAAKTP